MRFTLRSARASLRSAHRDLVFRRTFARLLRDPMQAIRANRQDLSDLVYGWGNEGWSGQHEYLAGCVEAAATTNGPILECGSGLTTLIVGAVAQQRGLDVWTLEHIPEWGERVSVQLDRYCIKSVRLHVAPLKRYDEFEWYGAPVDQMHQAFSLVICDGPPSATYGGRYGLLPVMAGKLAPGCIVLLDDAARPSECEVAVRWAAETGCSASLQGIEKPYFRVQLDS